jgi:hypothetical protein
MRVHVQSSWRTVIPLSVVLSTIAFAQHQTVVPNENLVAEGVPPIPASLAETVERYSNFRGASLAGWDPDRREMLISTRFADVPQIHLVKMPGGARNQMTFYPHSHCEKRTQLPEVMS